MGVNDGRVLEEGSAEETICRGVSRTLPGSTIHTRNEVRISLCLLFVDGS